jgi:TusA-related sulfurtransferase
MVVAMRPPREVELDTRGTLCPRPILDLVEAMEGLPVGTVLRVRADDAAIAYDLPAWCEATGHELLGLRRVGAEHVGRVRKMHDRS